MAGRPRLRRRSRSSAYSIFPKASERNGADATCVGTKEGGKEREKEGRSEGERKENNGRSLAQRRVSILMILDGGRAGGLALHILLTLSKDGRQNPCLGRTVCRSLEVIAPTVFAAHSFLR